ncbi:MAG: restriction endonuclease [Gammaproteobacteria bacterium]
MMPVLVNDLTHLAISLIEKRLRGAFPDLPFEVNGTPAQPYQGRRKGADGGIDGIIYFQDEKHAAKRIIVSVKGGENVGPTMVKDLIATVAGEKTQIGLFITLAVPTKSMIAEAATTPQPQVRASRRFRFLLLRACWTAASARATPTWRLEA